VEEHSGEDVLNEVPEPRRQVSYATKGSPGQILRAGWESIALWAYLFFSNRRLANKQRSDEARMQDQIEYQNSSSVTC